MNNDGVKYITLSEFIKNKFIIPAFQRNYVWSKENAKTVIRKMLKGWNDKKGKDTYRHREAGSETVIISSKNRMAMIKEVENEMPLEELLDMVSDKDFIIVEGYKKSPLRKIEVFRSGVSKNIITPKDKLICLATDTKLDIEGIEQVSINDYRKLTDCLEKLKYNDERRC